jgi:hypothetical protein
MCFDARNRTARAPLQLSVAARYICTMHHACAVSRNYRQWRFNVFYFPFSGTKFLWVSQAPAAILLSESGVLAHITQQGAWTLSVSCDGVTQHCKRRLSQGWLQFFFLSRPRKVYLGGLMAVRTHSPPSLAKIRRGWKGVWLIRWTSGKWHGVTHHHHHHHHH